MAALARKAHGAALAVVESAPDRYAVSGSLTFATAQQAVAGGIKALSASHGVEIEVDLRDVVASDSAGLAVLIEWRAWARRNGRTLRFKSVPEGLRTIARISELEPLLFGG